MAYLQEWGKAKAYKDLIEKLSTADDTNRRLLEQIGTNKTYAIGQATLTPATSKT